MNLELSDREKIFLNEYLKSFDPHSAVIAAFPDIIKPKDQINKFEELKGRFLIRREIEAELNKVTDGSELNEQFITRKIFERCADDTDKSPQIKALQLASEIKGLKKEQIFIHINEKSDEELQTIIAKRLNKNGTTDIA